MQWRWCERGLEDIGGGRSGKLCLHGRVRLGEVVSKASWLDGKDRAGMEDVMGWEGVASHRAPELHTALATGLRSTPVAQGPERGAVLSRASQRLVCSSMSWEGLCVLVLESRSRWSRYLSIIWKLA